MDIEELTRPLEIDEIDFRVQSINKGGYVTILAYKDARVDMKRLNEVYGQGFWKRSHQEIGGRLYCTIEVWNDEIKQWCGVQDVGTESRTEKEKGQASDSFKRAGFNLGIGTELYDYPVISFKLNDDEWNQNKDKPQATWNFKLKEWKWTTVFNVHDEMVYMTAHDEKGIQRFQWKRLDKNGHRFKRGEKQEIYIQVMNRLQAGDEKGLKEIIDEYQEHEERMKFWAIFSSSERDSMKKLMKDD